MLVRVADESLTTEPLAQRLRRSLLEDALRFYKDILAKLDGDTERSLQILEIHWRMRDIQRDLGRFDEMRQDLGREIELLDRLIAIQPSVIRHRHNRAGGGNPCLDIRRKRFNDPDESASEVHYRKAFELYSEISRQWPDHPQPVTNCLRQMAKAALERGTRPKRTDSGANRYGKETGIYQRIRKTLPLRESFVGGTRT